MPTMIRIALAAGERLPPRASFRARPHLLCDLGQGPNLSVPLFPCLHHEDDEGVYVTGKHLEQLPRLVPQCRGNTSVVCGVLAFTSNGAVNTLLCVSWRTSLKVSKVVQWNS